MSGISAVESEGIVNLGTYIEEGVKTEAISTDHAQANPAKSHETEKRMVAEESLRVATTPNLQEMYLIEEIKAKIKSADLLDIKAQFGLYKELFRAQFKAYQKSGKNVTQFIALARESLDFKEEGFSFSFAPFKKEERELFTSYVRMLGLAETAYKALQTHPNFERSYNDYYVQILELEESLGCPILEKNLAKLQFIFLTGTMLSTLKWISIAPFLPHPKEQQFYWTVYVKDAYKASELLEKRVPKDAGSFLFHIFDPGMVKIFPWKKNEVDPVALFFPFVVNYKNLEFVKGRFDEIHRDLPGWERALKWIELHLKAFEFLLPSHPEKAKAYLDSAKYLVRDTIWCYPFSPNSSSWNKTREEALAKIAEAEQKAGKK